MPFVDIGVNLLNEAFDRDRELVVRRAAEAGVTQLVITGSSVESSRAALAYAADYKARASGDSGGADGARLYATSGIHPHEARFFNSDSVSVLRGLALRYGAVAIGECGLDYNRDFSPRPIQRRCFEAQLALAFETGLPLFLHERDAEDSREAFADFSAMLKNAFSAGGGGKGVKAVVHCFTGNRAELETYLELGCHIGVTGWICDERRGVHVQELIPLIPSDRLMLETDAPYLFPRDKKPKRGRNESAFLPHVANAVARAAWKPIAHIMDETTRTARAFFGI